MDGIDHIQSVMPGKFPALEIKPVSGETETGESFADLLAMAIDNVQGLSETSNDLKLDLALGRPVELHQVMLAGAKAQLALELLIEIRNKLIEAYQEISRMPV